MRQSTGMFAVFVSMLLAQVPAAAGTLHTSNGKTYNGAVLKMNVDTVTYLWQKQKGQSDIIKSGDADELFRAQGQKTVAWEIPMGDVVKINDVPADQYQALYTRNGFFRIFEEFAASMILVTGQGDFLHQIKSIVIFLALLLVMTPLALMLVSLLAGSERLAFLGGIGLVLLMTLVGMGCALVSKLAVGMSPALATPGAQIALTVVFLLILGLIVNFASRFTFLQGLVFAVTWGVCLIAVGRVTTLITGVPIE